MADDDQVILQSQDGQDFKLEVKCARISETVKGLIEDAGVDAPIPLPPITGAVLGQVCEYMKHCGGSEDARAVDGDPAELKLPAAEVEWRDGFLKVTDERVAELILAANYLNIPTLLSFTGRHFAGFINGQSTEAIRKRFNIVNDFSPEEETQVKRENEWCDEL